MPSVEVLAALQAAFEVTDKMIALLQEHRAALAKASANVIAHDRDLEHATPPGPQKEGTDAPINK